MHVIDLEGNHHPAQITYTWDGELNGNQSLSATILPSKVNLEFISNLTEMWVIVDDEETEYKIIYCKRKGSGNKMTADIKAIPMFFDSFDTQRVHKRIDQHMTANAYFNLVFHEPDELGNASGYNFILNGTFEAQQWEGAGEGVTRLEMFKNGLNRYKAEFRISGNTIYLENQIGIDSQFRYEHRLNASNIVQEIDANEFWTYAKGYGDYGDGAGGEDWQNAKLIREYTSPLAQIPSIGIREAPPIKNGNITTTATMDDQLKILVNESLKISVIADIHDLTKQGYPIAQSNLGDRVFLIDRRIGFNEEIRVVRKSITKNWKGDILDIKLTFGSPGLVRRHQSNLSTAVKNITSLLEGNLKLPFSVLDNAVAEATKALQNMTSELSIPTNGGLMAVDKNNPNNLVLFNAAGLGVSDDGGATFKNAITGLGINASVITAGTMLADRIAGGILMSLNSNTEFNMNTGKLIMKKTDFELGNGARINFTDRNNLLFFENNSVYSGINFDYSLGTTNPLIGIGVSDLGFNMNDLSFNGIRIHSGASESSAEGVMTNIISNQLWLNSHPQYEGGGYVFENIWPGTRNRAFYGMNGSQFGYDLGFAGGGEWDNGFIKKLNNVERINGWDEILFRNRYESSGAGWTMKLAYAGEPTIDFYPVNTGTPYYYNLGRVDNRINRAYLNIIESNLIGGERPVETINANNYLGGSMRKFKANEYIVSLEDAMQFVTAEVKEFDYINNQDSIYDRKVSIILDDLQMEKAYLVKGSEETVDLGSAIFMNQRVLQDVLKRLGELENGTDPTATTA